MNKKMADAENADPIEDTGGQATVASIGTGGRVVEDKQEQEPAPVETPISPVTPAANNAESLTAACSEDPEIQLKEGTRIRFKESTPPAGTPCLQEIQTRVCVNGKYSSWTGSFLETSCKETAQQAQQQQMPPSMVQNNNVTNMVQNNTSVNTATANCQVSMQSWATATAPSNASFGISNLVTTGNI